MDYPRVIADRYRLLELIGQGGMALVFRIEDQRLQVERALKCLLPELAVDEVRRKRFENEARVMARLRHPHIVAVHDVGVHDGVPFMVMDWMAGGSLGHYLSALPALPEKDAVQATRAVLAALQVAHAADVIHRDIKPENVLLDDGGIPHLADFGIARIGDVGHGLTETGHVMGTLAYMAPEQNIDSREVDIRADIYATGALLFALATGRKPYALHQEEQDSPRFAQLSESLRPIVFQATRFRREDRYSSAQEMVVALETASAVSGDRVVECKPVQQQSASSPSLGEDVTFTTGGGFPEGAEPVPLVVPEGGRKFWNRMGIVGVISAGLVLFPAAWFGLEMMENPAPPSTPVSPASSVGVATSIQEAPPQDQASISPAPPAPTDVATVSQVRELPAVASPAPETPQISTNARPSKPVAPNRSTRSGRVFINAIPPATLVLDGKQRGLTGWKGDISGGKHTVVLTREGYNEVNRTLVVEPGQVLRFCWDFERDGPCVRR